MLAHGFPITHLPQKLEKHHQPAKRGDRSLRLAQFHFFSAPKSGNFPVHCFVLLGVSFIQLKLNRVRAKQCYSISEFWFIRTLFRCCSFVDFSRRTFTVMFSNVTHEKTGLPILVFGVRSSTSPHHSTHT